MICFLNCKRRILVVSSRLEIDAGTTGTGRQPPMHERRPLETKPTLMPRHLDDGFRREQTLQPPTGAIVDRLRLGRERSGRL